MPDAALLNRTQLPRPNVTPTDAEAILREHYGLTGTVTELGSQQDRNFRIHNGRSHYVLKITRADYALSELEAQNAAMHLLNRSADAPRVPEPVANKDGHEIFSLSINDEDCHVRLLTWLDGEPLTRRKHLAVPTVAALGALCAEVAKSLQDFDHPGLDRELQWDLRRAGPVILHLLSTVSEQETKDRIAKATVAALRPIRLLADRLRVQAVHHDITDDNVVTHIAASGRLVPDGVIDFGDVVKSWLVGDLAVTCAALLHHADNDPFYILPAIRAYHDINPLTVDELKALWPLIVARAAVLVSSSEQQIAIEPENDYVRGNAAHEWEIFDLATSVPIPLMETAILQATGMLEWPENAAVGRLLPTIEPDQIRLTDLGVLSTSFAADNWSDPEIDWKLLAKSAWETGMAVTRYGEYRLSCSRVHSSREPENFALHVDLCVPAGTAAVAPFPGQVKRGGDHGLVFSGDHLTLHADGLDCPLEEGSLVEAGEPLGKVAGAEGSVGGLRLRLCRDGNIVPPLFSTPGHAAAWAELCPSPSGLLGLDVAAPVPSSEILLERRKESFARPQKHYYETPPQFERGWRQHLYEIRGRAYLDMVNNVAIAGHGHPLLTAAAEKQWSLLNTNSRFHYAALAEFSERLAALAPEGLDTVFLVNSGSEANDLALRLAFAFTGRRNIISLLEAYHGWTVASDAVSTSIADNPQALKTRPSWVHPVMAPNTYRGPFRGADSAPSYLKAVTEVLEKIDGSGEGLAGFICEAVYGNAGGISLPSGYLKDVYGMVRECGGVTIADEVQVGYGRLGHYFWGFEEQGVVPDIITVAKGMGNGHPLGAVITRRDIAESLEKEGYFFSSSGGSPVSCVIGTMVLDILRDEGLQENARDVGDYLKARFENLVEYYPLIGAVHGMGLYLGLEFVRDRETLEPATEETRAICERLLELGVIMQPTGDHQNILKIKPPLCITRDSANFFVSMLEKVLSEGC